MKKRSIFLVSTIVFMIIVILIILKNGTYIAAQFADNVLRPLLGEQKTIALESAFFGLSEGYKSIKYKFIAPDSSLFSSGPSVSPEVNVDKMILNPISFSHDFSPLSGEGKWVDVPSHLFPNELVMAKTVVRPDPKRSYAMVALVKVNMNKVKINAEAGITHPGAIIGHPGPGFVPQVIKETNNLMVVFNGGFQYKDGKYGMVVNGKIYVPLRPGLATLVMDSAAPLKIINYQNQQFPSTVYSLRQNGPLLVDKGQITSFVEGGVDSWGRTTTSTMYTWRSGIGLDAQGNLIYAVGGSLIPETLAKALQSAGAIEAMQLDINPTWVRFILFNSQGNGKYTYEPLIKDMVDGGKSYLQGYSKDFFYLYKK